MKLTHVLCAVAALLAAGCASLGGSDNPMVGTWKMEADAKALEQLPPGAKAPEMTMEFKGDGTFTARMSGISSSDSNAEGTYKLEGNTLTLTLTKEDGKPSNDKPEAVVLSEDKKSFAIPGSDGMGKMVKQ